MRIFAAVLVASLVATASAAPAGNVQIIEGKPAQGGSPAVKNKPFDTGGLYLVSLDCHPYALDPDNRNNFFASLIQNRTRQLLFTLTISTDPIGPNEVPPAASVLVAVPVVADTLSSIAPVTTKNGTCSQSFLATGRTALYLTSLYTDQINTKPSQLVTVVEALASTVAPLAALFPKGPAALITTDTTIANSMAQPYANLVGAISWQSSETDTAPIEEGSYRVNTPVGYVLISVNKLSSLQDALKISDIQKALDNAWQTAGAALETELTSDPAACHTAGRKLETNGNFSHADAVDALAHIVVDDPAITSSQATACLGTDYGPEVANNSYFRANARDLHLGPGFTDIVSGVPYNSLVFKGIASSMTAYAGGNANVKTTLDSSFEPSVKVIDAALGMFDGSPTTIEAVLDKLKNQFPSYGCPDSDSTVDPILGPATGLILAIGKSGQPIDMVALKTWWEYQGTSNQTRIKQIAIVADSSVLTALSDAKNQCGYHITINSPGTAGSSGSPTAQPTPAGQASQPVAKPSN